MLTLSRITKSFAGMRAVDGVDLTLAPGEILGFVGANGSGKTTTMRIIMGLLDADEGAIRWHGSPITDSARRQFGYMPEERGLYAGERVDEQLYYFGRLRGLTPRECRKAVERVAADLLIERNLARKAGALSLGNQQKVQLAVALLTDPALLILDEPFSGLDPQAVATLSDLLRQRANAGIGILFSSHQLSLVEQSCDRIAILSQGKVVAAGQVSDLTEPMRDECFLQWRAEVPEVPGHIDVVERLPNRTLHLRAEPEALKRYLHDQISAGNLERFQQAGTSLEQRFAALVGDSR